MRRATTDSLGNRTRYNYDPAGRTTEVIDPAGNSVKFAYDLNGNRISSTDQRGNVTQYAYDVLNRLSSRTDPLLSAETFTYAPNGLLERATDREGKISLRAYDSINRLSRISFGATAATPTVFESTIDYTYDKGDRLLRALDSVGGAIDSTYDGLDRLTKETTPLGTVSYSYDKAGRRLQMLPSGQQSVDYAYDAASRLTEVRNAVNATAAQDVVRITYDNADRYSRVQLRNGVNVDYAYDAAGQLSSITYSTAVATIGGLAYDYDAAGRVIRTGGSLAQVNLPAAVSGKTYNANNQLTLPGYTYDKNGRLTSNGSQSYLWNARDELKQIQSGPSLVGEFSYDAAGRRIRKSVYSTPTQFLYDGANIIQELGDGPAPAVNATLLTGLGVDEAFGRTKGTAKTEYLSDRLGSTIALSDASASSATTYSYEPYGNATQAGLPDDNARAFTGREDDGTGLLYYRARYYDPAGGRFISDDPIGIEGGINLYGYVLGDPANGVDPLGLATYFCQKPLDALNRIPGNGDPKKRKSVSQAESNGLYHQYICVGVPPNVVCGSLTTKDHKPFGPGVPSSDTYSPDRCTKHDDDNSCLENCLSANIKSSYRPYYALYNQNRGHNCQTWTNFLYESCARSCGMD